MITIFGSIPLHKKGRKIHLAPELKHLSVSIMFHYLKCSKLRKQMWQLFCARQKSSKQLDDRPVKLLFGHIAEGRMQPKIGKNTLLFKLCLVILKRNNSNRQARPSNDIWSKRQCNTPPLVCCSISLALRIASCEICHQASDSRKNELSTEPK